MNSYTYDSERNQVRRPPNGTVILKWELCISFYLECAWQFIKEFPQEIICALEMLF